MTDDIFRRWLESSRGYWTLQIGMGIERLNQIRFHTVHFGVIKFGHGNPDNL